MKFPYPLLLAMLIFVPGGPSVRADDVVPPAEVANLRLDKANADVVFAWDGVDRDVLGGSEALLGYRLYCSVSPDFVPDKDGGSNRIAEPTAAGHAEAGGLANAAIGFCLVSAVDAAGSEGNTRPSRVSPVAVEFATVTAEAVAPTWSAASPAAEVDGYRVLYGDASMAYHSAVDVGNVTTTTLVPPSGPVPTFLATLAYDSERNVAVDPDDEFAIGAVALRQEPAVTGAGQEPVRDDIDADAAAVFAPPTGAPGGSTLLHSGEQRLDRIDLAIPGRGQLDFVLTRRYRSQLDYDGPLGFGWDYGYNEALYIRPDGDVLRSDGAGNVALWRRNPDGSFDAPAGHFRTLIRRADGSYALRATDGAKRIFDAEGRLASCEDRSGNTMQFDYDTRGNLDLVIDVFGRVIDFQFALFADGRDRLVKVVDFIGRELVYSYDSAGNLVGVRTPRVVGTSTGNDFPEGRSERYSYSGGSPDAELNHNLLTVTLPQETDAGGPPVLTLSYGTAGLAFDRVTAATLGGTNESGVPAGGTLSFEYETLGAGQPVGNPDVPRIRTRVTERNGNLFESYANELNHEIQFRRLTRGLRPGEPAFFETRSFYDADGQLLRRILPESNELRLAYGSGSRAAMRNVVERRIVADATRGGGEDLVTTFEYEPVYNQVAATTDPRGNAAGFVPPLGSSSPGRYTTRMTFDYQEGTDPIPDVVEFGIDLKGVPRGLGDQNGDGFTDDVAGHVVRIEEPAVELRPESGEAARLGSSLQPVLTEIRWNQRGQPTALIDPEGNLTTFERYPDDDPDGDGTPVAARGHAARHDEPIPAGWLAAITVDAGPTPRRTTAAPAAVLRTGYAYDEVGNLLSVRDPRGVLTTIERNALNEPVTITRGADVSQAVTSGQLLTGETAFGYRRRLHYDFNGRPVLIEQENRDGTTPEIGEWVELTYAWDILNNAIRVVAEVDASTVATTERRYDPNELLERRILPEGNVDRYEYDERNLLWRETAGEGSPEASTIGVDYDRNGNPLSVFDAEDNDGDGQPEAATFLYDGFDRPIRFTDALGNFTLNDYDVASNLVRQREFGHPADAPAAPAVLHGEARHAHDELNRLFRVDRALFLAAGFMPLRAVDLRDGDADGWVTTFHEYDALSRPTFLSEDDGETARRVWDGADREIERIDAFGNRRLTVYDKNGNPTEVRTIEKATASRVPDEEYVAFYVWDQLDRIVRISGDHTWRFQWDSRDNVVQASDAQGAPLPDPLGFYPGTFNAPGNTTHYRYDGRNLLIEETRDLRVDGQGGMPIDVGGPFNPDGRISLAYEYDRNARLAAVVDDNGNRTELGYDALNRLTTILNADQAGTSFSYDRDGNLVSTLDENGTLVEQTHDALNRLLERQITPASGTSGTVVETYAYDGLSRLTTATDDNGDIGASHEVRRIYDSLSRLLEEQQDGAPRSSVWSGDGKLLSTTYPGGRTIERLHDVIDRPTRIQDSGGPLADYAWIGPGIDRLLDRRHGNDTRLSLLNDAEDRLVGYDDWKRVIRLRHGSDSGSFVDRSYDYNRTDRRLSEGRADDGGLTDRYIFDSTYRLIRSEFDRDGAGDPRELTGVDYLLDGVGNRRSVSRETALAGQAEDSYLVNEVNEYAETAGAPRVHDDNGNLLDDGTLVFEFDYKDRLIAVLRAADMAPVARYEYDALDRRVRKTVLDPDDPAAPGASTRYYYDDAWQVIEETSAGQTTATYVYGVGLDEPVQRVTTAASPHGAGTHFLHQNVRGDVVALSDEAGELVETFLYDDYGNVAATSAHGNPYLFQGRRFDEESGLYHLRYRAYDPRTGRFISRDAARDPDNVGNAYSFAGNDPVGHGDPLGLARVAIKGFILYDSKMTPEALKGTALGVYDSLYGFGEFVGAIVVGGYADALGADRNGYFGDAIRKADRYTEAAFQLADKPSEIWEAPRRNFQRAMDKGDVRAASRVYSTFAFDAVTMGEGLLTTALKSGRVAVNLAYKAESVLYRGMRMRALRQIARLEEAARRTAQAMGRNAAGTGRRYVVSAHGSMIDEIFRLPKNVQVNVFGRAGRTISVSKGMMIEAGWVQPTGVFRGGSKVAEMIFDTFGNGAKSGEYVVTTSRGVFTVAGETRLSTVVKQFSRMFPKEKIRIDVSACRSWDLAQIPRPVTVNLSHLNPLAAAVRATRQAIRVVQTSELDVQPDNPTVVPGLVNTVDVGANDSVPPGAQFVLVDAPPLHPDLWDWNQTNGMLTMTPLFFEAPVITVKYKVVAGKEESPAVDVIATLDYEPLKNPPVREEPGTGVLVVDVPTLVLEGQHYPVYQFALRNLPTDVCDPPHWHAPFLVFPLEAIMTGILDPAVHACGFGTFLDVPQEVVTLVLQDWITFKNLHPPMF